MIQPLLVALIFMAAVAYLARVLFRSFQSKTDCASGCGKCSAVDFKKLEAELREKGI
jgi:hypothetical protein